MSVPLPEAGDDEWMDWAQQVHARVTAGVPTYAQATAPDISLAPYLWVDTSGETLTLWHEDGVA